MTFLLDANVLIARVFEEHSHHGRAVRWLIENPNFAVCPVTEGALLRAIYRTQAFPQSAGLEALTAIRNLPHFEFWPDSVSYLDCPLVAITGHRQVTDAYLATLARARGGQLATFDQGLVQIHSHTTLVS